MKPSLSFRAALAAAAFAASGLAHSQATAPAPAAPASPSTGPNPSLMTPQAPAAPAAPPTASAPAAKSATGVESTAPAATPGEPQRKRNRTGGAGKSNFMPANPDATPVLPGQGPKSRASGTDPGQPSGAGPTRGAQGDGAQGTGAPGGGKGSGKKKGGNRPIGMGRAFQDLQTKEEFTAYSAKAKAVKTTSECKALLESTKKELEPRAKAENKTIAVNTTEICDKAKSRGRLKD